MPPPITDDETIIRLTHHLPYGLKCHPFQALAGFRYFLTTCHPFQFSHETLVKNTSRGIEGRRQQKERFRRLVRCHPLVPIHDF